MDDWRLKAYLFNLKNIQNACARDKQRKGKKSKKDIEIERKIREDLVAADSGLYRVFPEVYDKRKK